MSRAADKLHMTQPAVSVQLKNLQDQFDIPLTEMIGKKLHITDFGHELAQIAEDILSGVSAIEHKTMFTKAWWPENYGLLLYPLENKFLPHYLSGFLRQYAHVELLLDVSQREKVVKCLEDNTAEFALISVVPDHLEVEEEILLPN